MITQDNHYKYKGLFNAHTSHFSQCHEWVLLVDTWPFAHPLQRAVVLILYLFSLHLPSDSSYSMVSICPGTAILYQPQIGQSSILAIFISSLNIIVGLESRYTSKVEQITMWQLAMFLNIISVYLLLLGLGVTSSKRPASLPQHQERQFYTTLVFTNCDDLIKCHSAMLQTSQSE